MRRTADGSDLWQGRIADGATRPLVETRDAEETWPFWSPAAGLLLYESRPAGQRFRERLRLLDPRTGESRLLSEGFEQRQHWSAWSPDGKRAVYAFTERRAGRVARGVAEVEIASGERRVLGPSRRGRKFFFRPEYAPDGRRVVVQLAHASEAGSELWILEAGAEPRRLTGDPPAFDSKARFTRDGEWVVLTRRAHRNGSGDLWLVRLRDGALRRFASSERGDHHSARPSPTRDEIVFVSDRDGGTDLFLAEIDGDAPRRLTRSPELREATPRWSPDGERIAFVVLGEALPGAVREGRVMAVDRTGRVLFESDGVMVDWMPPF